MVSGDEGGVEGGEDDQACEEAHHHSCPEVVAGFEGDGPGEHAEDDAGAEDGGGGPAAGRTPVAVVWPISVAVVMRR